MKWEICYVCELRDEKRPSGKDENVDTGNIP
jgi:hypothetical protein